MPQKLELRSTEAGRPLNSFGEAAYRVRAWHWLGFVYRVAGVDDSLLVDCPNHRLSKGLSQARRFEDVQFDGYDPNGIIAKGKVSLAKHVAGLRGYEESLRRYDHGFWKSLTRRSSGDTDGNDELGGVLKKHGLVRLSPVDQSNGSTLGLIQDASFESSYNGRDEGLVPYHVDKATHEATLDSLHLMLLLYREAQDLSEVHLANNLRRRLFSAANQFAENHHYADEQLDTWKYLIFTRMVKWNPMFEPAAKYTELAEDALYKDYKSRPPKPGRRGTQDPKTYKTGRPERRWRRAIWARACRIAAEELGDPEDPAPPDFLYVRADIGQWLIENRELISLHHDLSIQFLMDEDPATFVKDGIPWNEHPPLRMPETLFKRRKRPPSDAQNEFHFGSYLPFDVIPVKEI